MANLARKAREQIQAQYPGAAVIKRPRNGIHLDIGNNQRVAILGASNDYHLPDETEIDTAWVQESVDGYQWGMTLAEYHARAKSTLTDGALVRFTHPTSGHWVIFDPQSINWFDANGSRSQISIKQSVQATVGTGDDDDLLTWANAYGSGRHFTYRCVPQRLEKNIILDTAASLPAPPGYMVAPIQFEAEFTLSHSSGLDIYINGNLWTKQNNQRLVTASRIEFRAGAETLFGMVAPFARDANGEQVGGTYEVRNQSGTYYVVVRIAKEWLDAAAYPVSIDPTLDVQPDATAGIDTFLTEAAPTSNSGTSTTWRARYDGTNPIRRALIRFLLAGIPAGSDCTSAVMTLYASVSSTTDQHAVYILKVSDWTETGATWNTKDGTNAWPGSAGASTSGTDYEADSSPPLIEGALSDNYVDADLTSGANMTASKIASFFGGDLNLMIGGPGSIAADVVWSPSDYSTASFRPRLVITYSETRQRVYPTSDVSAGGWTASTGSDLYAMIDEATADDADYIQSPSNPQNAAFSVHLSNPDAPDVDTGHTVYYRYKKDNANQTVDLIVRLKQGGTTIASSTHSNISTSWTDGSFNLTEGEAANITDYTDLRIEFEADAP